MAKVFASVKLMHYLSIVYKFLKKAESRKGKHRAAL